MRDRFLFAVALLFVSVCRGIYWSVIVLSVLLLAAIFIDAVVRTGLVAAVMFVVLALGCVAVFVAICIGYEKANDYLQWRDGR